MAKPTIVTRTGKGSALTWTEGDANLTNLQTAAVPDGGASGEYLVKNSATNWDIGWTDRVTAKTIYENVKNVSGGSLAKGTPVYQVGVTGVATVTVGAARADDPAKLAIGVLDQTIADEAEGTMTILGEIKGVNTSGFTIGDAVYLGATGGFTNVAPTSSTVAVQFLGIVFRVHASNGSGFITGTLTPDLVKFNGTSFELWDGDSWVSAGMASFTAAGDSGTSQTIADGNTLTISGGTGLSSVASATDTITINLDNTAVTAASYTYASITVDAQGRITSASNGTTPLVSGGALGTPSSGTVTNLTGTASININGTVGATTASTGTFTNLSTTGTFTFKNPIEAIYNIGTTGGTIAPDPANGSVQQITLNSALTINAFTNPTAGESLTLIIYGGTAYTSITSTMKFAGGTKTLTGTAGCIDILSIYYDGTNYFASLGKGYA